ncbi:hypothetical protein [Bythopirellula polymerisocia]|uniref:Uncharacterized protein n=1 Tax=Bythopirellula polymerisocia TaxID=2528003 RepID=A0A5C6CBV1_9BACT|nr:hypothetical protein [Bythopirellula polymerisocia]TWU21317.1 hypothetical protein Pla144_47270 [Bythopirellula polymerisocia]
MNTQTSHDAHNHSNLGPLKDLPTIEAAEFANWTPEGKAPQSPCQVKPASTPKQNTALLRLLRAIVDHPGMPSSKYPKLTQMSPRKAVEVRKQLVKQGLVRETELQTKARGRAAIVLTPTEAAVEVLHAQDADQFTGGSTA